MSKTIRATIHVVVWIVGISGLILFFTNIRNVGDWWYLKSYTPPPAIQDLATQAHMTSAGRDVFYRSAPQIVSKRSDIVKYCALTDNQVAELGCYVSNNHIYLLDIRDPALKNEMIVTAAYEMLHPVYEHMDTSTRNLIDKEIEKIAPTITDPSILSQIQIYADTEPGSRDEELYSILGTEYPHISTVLEANYALYLADRTGLVSYHLAFEQVYTNLSDQITQLDGQIKSIKANMQAYRQTGQINQYNALVAQVNSLVDIYNADVVQYNKYGQDLFGQESVSSSP